jgi:hypothetical protein
LRWSVPMPSSISTECNGFGSGQATPRASPSNEAVCLAPDRFSGYLEVEPSIGDEEEYQYVISQPPRRLELSVYEYAGHIYISVYCAPHDRAVIDVIISQGLGARVVDDERGSFIEFAAANCFTPWTERYDGETPVPYGVRLFARPQIRIELCPALPIEL